MDKLWLTFRWYVSWFDVHLITAVIATKKWWDSIEVREGRKIIETEWKWLRHNNTGSTIKASFTVYSCYCMSEPCSYLHGKLWKFQPCTKGRVNDPFPDRALQELGRRRWNWVERSEKEHKKIGGTKSKNNCPIHLKRSLLHICAPLLPAWRSYDSHLKVHDCTSHARRVQYCSGALPDGALQKKW